MFECLGRRGPSNACRLASVFALVGVALCGCPRAAGAASWPAAQPVSTAGLDATAPRTSLGSDGELFVIWQGGDGINDRVQLATRPAGGSFSGPLTLSDPGGDALRPDLAAGNDGAALAAWQRLNGTRSRIEATLRPAGGDFESPQTLSDGSADAFDADVAGAGGNFVVAWYEAGDYDASVRAAVRAPGVGFGPVQALSAGGAYALDPQVGIDGDGGAVAVWKQRDGGRFRIEAATREPGGSFDVAQAISPAGVDATDPQLSTNASGETLAVWRQFDGDHYRIEAAARPANGPFGTAAPISPAGADAFEPRVALSDDGEAAVAWYRSDGITNRVETSLRSAAGSFGPAQTISPAGKSAIDPQVSIGPGGTAVLAWHQQSGSTYAVESATREPGGPFASSVELSSADQSALEPNVDASEATQALVWSRFDGANFRIESSVAESAPEPPGPDPTGAAGGQGLDLTQPPAATTLLDRVAPVVSRFSVSPRFAVRPVAAAPRSRRLRRGGRIRFRLSEPAVVSITVRAIKSADRLTGMVVARPGLAGANAIAFSGRLGRRALARGRYRATIVATDAAGNRSVPRGDVFEIAGIRQR